MTIDSRPGSISGGGFHPFRLLKHCSVITRIQKAMDSLYTLPRSGTPGCFPGQKAPYTSVLWLSHYNLGSRDQATPGHTAFRMPGCSLVTSTLGRAAAVRQLSQRPHGARISLPKYRVRKRTRHSVVLLVALPCRAECRRRAGMKKAFQCTGEAVRTTDDC